jgi:dCMP deaminase
MREQQWWDNWFLDLAIYVSTASKDPSTKCGAVIVDPSRRLVSVGYNGLAKGVKDTDERLNNRELKYKIIVHAERNAIIFAQRNLSGNTLYTWPFMPCATCAAMVIQAGITRVVAPRSNNPRWIDDFKLSQEMFAEASVDVVLKDTTWPA